jgi:hypothetical protein
MTPYEGLWGSTQLRRTAMPNDIWPVSRDLSITPPARKYAGYYVDRQNRFYIRSLRRDGLYDIDFPSVLLWIEDVPAPENGFCL